MKMKKLGRDENLDRDEALRLIARWERRTFPGFKVGPAELTYYFGGNRIRWGSILKSGDIPSSIDLECLRQSIDLVGDQLRRRCQHIRARARGGIPPRWAMASCPSAKKVIQRRDGGTYDEDLYNAVGQKLNHAILGR